MKRLTVLGVMVGATLLSAAPFSLQWSQKSVVLSLDSAEARVGRPLPTSISAESGSRALRRKRWCAHSANCCAHSFSPNGLL